jgi:hypothetical protein
MRDPIYITKQIDSQSRELIIESDDFSIWAYLMDSENENNIILDGFICSLGKVLDSTAEVKDYIEKGYAPPISKDFLNDFTIQNDITEKDIDIKVDSKGISIYIRDLKFLEMDLINLYSFSRSISKSGPYGQTMD